MPPYHLRLWQPAPRFAAFNIVAVIAGGLALDAAFGWPGQIAAIIWTLAVFTWLYARGGVDERRVLVLCLFISGFGEVILSLVWGLYDYQFHNVPLFVPPGHALLMTLGILVSNKLPTARSRPPALPLNQLPSTFNLVNTIASIAFIYAAFAWFQGWDEFGALLYLVFAACMILGRAKALYASMFVLALMMELYGTALGNWVWRDVTPLLHTTSTNPPFSAGAFYCLLDLLVLSTLRLWPRQLPSTSV